MRIHIPYGNKSTEIEIKHSKVLQVLEPLSVPTLNHRDCKRSIEKAIIQLLPFCSSFTIIVPDITRIWVRSSFFTSLVVETLFRFGIKAEKITILIATGSHRSATKEEITTITGKGVAKRLRIINHDCHNNKKLTYWGETSYGNRVYLNSEASQSDCIIIIGGVMFHLIAGFGGGRKYILPGIAGYDTIQKNHSLTILPDGSPHPEVRPSVLASNPVNKDMIEGAAFLLKKRKSLLINIIDSGYNKLSGMIIGDWYNSWQKACSFLEKFHRISIPTLADFVIVSAGGHNKDAILYQSIKALFNAALCVKPGGRIIFLTQCRNGIGNKEFANAMVTFREKPALLGRILTNRFSMPTYVAYSTLNLLKHFNITLISDLPPSLTEELGFNCNKNLERLINDLPGTGYIIPFGENILPALRS